VRSSAESEVYKRQEQALDRSIPTTKAKFRFTYEDIKLPANEKVGFLGLSSLYDVNDWLSVGAATYGAMSGKRGGFITMGGAAEVRQLIIDRVEVNSGLFVGAGGGRGGFNLSGGGLMLRYHLGLKYETSSMGALGASISYLDFPDGTIHSTQPYISYELPFRTLILSGGQEHDDTESFSMGSYMQAEQEFSPVFRSYLVPAGVLTDNGAAQRRKVDLVGVEWNRYLNDSYYFHLESLGAMGGGNRGYMQTLIGGGYRMMLWDGSWLKSTVSAGMAGGGNVATGGGLLIHTEAGFQQRLSDHLYAEVLVVM